MFKFQGHRLNLVGSVLVSLTVGSITLVWEIVYGVPFIGRVIATFILFLMTVNIVSDCLGLWDSRQKESPTSRPDSSSWFDF